MTWTADEKKRLLESSGVKYRCVCGNESRWRRETRLPGGWSLTWVARHGESLPAYICPDCVAAKKTYVEKAEGSGIEAWRHKLTSLNKRKKGRRK